METNNELQKRSDAAIVGSYNRYPAAMVKGSGCCLWDADGRKYLDFLSGIAVCALGHSHPRVTESICRQASELVHVSNLYYTKPQIELAELLTQNSFAEKVFFCNSGAEANEAAIKLARLYSRKGRYKIVSLDGSFHGRTLAALAATGQKKFHEGFEPMPQGFVHAPFGDLAALEACIDESTCAILCEPIQGESGVRPLERNYLQGIKALCEKHDLLLIFDEVQTGMGRTGSLFAYQQLGITPDIMSVSKALANGLPMGAMVTTAQIAAVFVPGTHATTFGGNPVAAAAALTTLQVLLEDGFLAEVASKGEYFRQKLNELAKRFPGILVHGRGLGLLVGGVLTEEGISQGAAIVNAMFERGYLLNFAGNAVLRFVPPLIVTTDEIDEIVTALAAVLEAL